MIQRFFTRGYPLKDNKDEVVDGDYSSSLEIAESRLALYSDQQPLLQVNLSQSTQVQVEHIGGEASF
jgi:hypothetical protein